MITQNKHALNITTSSWCCITSGKQ